MVPLRQSASLPRIDQQSAISIWDQNVVRGPIAVNEV